MVSQDADRLTRRLASSLGCFTAISALLWFLVMRPAQEQQRFRAKEAGARQVLHALHTAEQVRRMRGETDDAESAGDDIERLAAEAGVTLDADGVDARNGYRYEVSGDEVHYTLVAIPPEAGLMAFTATDRDLIEP